MSNISRLTEVLTTLQEEEGLLAIRYFPTTILTVEALAGGILDLLEAETVEDKEIF